jgi:uncharacterized protein YndB with AHSA1/START domain
MLERQLSHSPEKIWRALTEVKLLDEWLMKSDFQPVVGHVFQFRSQPYGDWDGLVHAEVLTVEPPRELAYRWDALGLETVVTWTLTATDGGTHLKLEQAGFKADQAQAFGGAKYGWKGFLDALEGFLERE